MNYGVPNDATLAAVLIFALFTTILAVIAEKVHFFSRAVRWIQKDPVIRTALVALLFAIGPITARTKNGQMSLPRPPLLLQVEEPAPEPSIAPVTVRTNGVVLRAESTNAVEITAFRRIGGTELGDWIETAAPFFAVGTQDVSRCYVSASGSISFNSMRRPPVGQMLPDGTGLHVLCPLRAPLGMVPEANWTNANTQSRFWHDVLPGGGKVLTWENALVDRLPGRRVTLQVELQPTGDSVYRYDFHDALNPPPTNFVMGAQMGTNGVNALSVLGTSILAATVWNMDGAPVTNGVSITNLLCTNGVLRTPASFEIRWKNTTGLDPEADTDGDGLTDWAEIFLWGTHADYADTDGDGTADNVELMMGTDPFDADEDGDGVPDGTSAVAWVGHPLWAANSTNESNVVITLNESIPCGASATLILDDLAIPLQNSASWSFSIPEGALHQSRLFVAGTETVNLSINAFFDSLPPAGNGETRFFFAPPGIFGAGNGISETGSFGFFTARLRTLPQEGLPECIHEIPGQRDYEVVSSPIPWSELAEGAQIDGFSHNSDGTLSLSVDDTPPSVATGTISLRSENGFLGTATLSASIHRCGGTDDSSCHHCEHYPVTSVCATNVFFTLPAEGGDSDLPNEGRNPETSFVYHNWVENPDYSIRDYAVLLHPVLGDCEASPSDLQGSWQKLSGPNSGTTSITNEIDLLLRKPEIGGIYSFQFDESSSYGTGSVESSVILPLGGPDVTAYLYSEMQRYASWATSLRNQICSNPDLDNFQKGSKLLGFFAQTAAAMNHKLGTYETANSPYKPLCNNTVTIGGHVLGKDQIGNILFAFAANRIGLDLPLTRFGGNAFAVFTGTSEHPDDLEAYTMGFVLGYNPEASIQRILENRNLSVLQSEQAKIGWPSSETVSGTTYPVYGLQPTNE